jgi:hypothetical protein
MGKAFLLLFQIVQVALLLLAVSFFHIKFLCWQLQLLLEAFLKHLSWLSLGFEEVELFGKFICLSLKFVAWSGSWIVEDFGFGYFGTKIVENDLVLHENEMIRKRFLILFMPLLSIKLNKLRNQ